MKKQILVFLITVLCGSTLHGQVLKISNGCSFSSIYMDKGAPLLNKNVSSYSIFVGAEYLEKKWFMLSSEIGYFAQGGKDNVSVVSDASDPGTETEWKERHDYLQLNTTFRVMTPTYPLFFYVGIGPKLDILIGDRNFQESVLSPYWMLNRFVFGAKTEVGFTYDMKSHFRVGLNVSYNLNLSSPGKSEYSDLSYRTFLGMLTLGYRL